MTLLYRIFAVTERSYRGAKHCTRELLIYQKRVIPLLSGNDVGNRYTVVNKPPAW